MSGLDKVGHPFGPESLESIDMLYHIDRDIKRIIDHAHKRYGAANTLVALTADHGIIPIPELVHKAGYSDARRILTADLKKTVNDFAEKKFGHKELITGIVSNNVYFNHKIFDALAAEEKRKILSAVKKYLMRQPGIKHVWTPQELAKTDYHMELHDLESFCRNQIETHRSGQLYIFVHPYNLLTNDKFGVTHLSPYDYDTHIPLMVYQKGKFQSKRVMDIVWAQQVAPTLAYVLQVPRPSASTYNVLPGLFI